MPFRNGQPRPAGAGRKPGSHNKATAELRALIDEGDVPDLIQRLYAMARSRNKQLSLAAIKELLDRRYGRPKQSIDVGGDVSLLQTIILEREPASNGHAGPIRAEG